MKFLFLFFVLGVASCANIKDVDTGKQTLHLNRQVNLWRLFHYTHMPNAHKDQVEIAKNFNFDVNYQRFNNVNQVKEFYKIYKNGMLPITKIFTITNEVHRREAIALFNVFYNAIDYDTFYRVACWAREYVNQGTFLYAMHVAVFHREDLKGFFLPPLHEINPYFFLNFDVINKMHRLKMQGQIIDKNLARTLGITQLDDTFVIRGSEAGYYTNKYNKEYVMTYFTNDVGLNNYYYYHNIKFPTWMKSDQFNTLYKDRRGEIFYFFHKQLLARFYLERLSNGLGEINDFSFYKTIKCGHRSFLTYHNGLQFPSRPDIYDLRTDYNVDYLNEIGDCESTIRKTIKRGVFLMDDGTMVSVKNNKDINVLGNLIQNNLDSVNLRVCRNINWLVRTFLGNSVDTDDNMYTVPSLMDHFETTLRDPMSWQLIKRFMKNFVNFKNYMTPYKRSELLYNGVKIQDVIVDKLVTFFDSLYMDATNAVFASKDERETNKRINKFVVEKNVLNHVPFDVKINVDSDKTTDVLVKIFLGPKYDNMGRYFDINDNRYNFMELDRFIYKLNVGTNNIVRKSIDFMGYSDVITSGFMAKQFISGDDMTWFNKYNYYGFPRRLLLPKGTIEGKTFQFFVMITPVNTANYQKLNKDEYQGYKFLLQDDNAFDYPFDRRIDEYEFYNNGNMFFKDVNIFYKPMTTRKLSWMDVLFFHRYRNVDETYIRKNFMDGFNFMEDNKYGNDQYVNVNKNFNDDRTRFLTVDDTQYMDKNNDFLNKDTLNVNYLNKVQY